MKAVYGF